MEDKPILQNQDGKEIVKLPSKKKLAKRIIRNILFISFWLYVLIRLFITDIDLLVAENLGIQNVPLFVTLRLLILLIIFFLIWKTIGNKRFWKNIGLFFLFPIYPVGWVLTKGFAFYLPGFLLYSNLHFTLYSYIELIITFIVDFKKTSLKILLFVLAFIILFNLDSYWLIFPIIIFSFLQLNHIHKRYKQTFEPIKIFRIDLDSEIFENDKPFLIDKVEKKLDKISKDKRLNDEEKVFKKIEHILLISEFAKSLSISIKDILNNRTYFKSFLWKILFSLFFSMVLIGGINYALYKMDPVNYNFESEPKFYDFFFYSFFTIIPDGTDITPASTIAKTVKMIGVLIGVIINLLVLTFYVAVANDKYREKLSKLSIYSNEYSESVKSFFRQKYGYDPSEYIEKIKNRGDYFKDFSEIVSKILLRKKK